MSLLVLNASMEPDFVKAVDQRRKQRFYNKFKQKCLEMAALFVLPILLWKLREIGMTKCAKNRKIGGKKNNPKTKNQINLIQFNQKCLEMAVLFVLPLFLWKLRAIGMTKCARNRKIGGKKKNPRAKQRLILN